MCCKYKALLLIGIFTLSFISCTHDQVLEIPCLPDMMAKYDMQRWDPEEPIGSGCRMYLSAAWWRGDYYFQFGNPCIDAVWAIVDCNEQVFCGGLPYNPCPVFMEEAVWIGVVAAGKR